MCHWLLCCVGMRGLCTGWLLYSPIYGHVLHGVGLCGTRMGIAWRLGGLVGVGSV